MITLFPHQQKALEQTKEQNKVAYYLDMGLGKTFVGSEKLKQLGGKINLVICQKSKVQDWVKHFREHYTNQYFVVYNMTTWEKADWNGLKNWTTDRLFTDVFIINYDLIFRRPELAKIHFDTIMLDESSLIQNEKTNRSKFILESLNHDNCILLSGTPTGGKYELLYSQCKLLGWNISKSMYWNTYIKCKLIKPRYTQRHIRVVTGYKNVERLKLKLREHGAVFMKSDEVFDLPQQIFTDIKVKPGKEYKEFCKKRIVKYGDTEFVGDTVLTNQLYKRMLCGYANDDKVKAFVDLVESTNDRLIVFYNFVNELSVLKNAIKDRPISIVNGELKDLTEYEKSENSVTFIQYQAGSMGLNLQKANKIIYFTPTQTSELYEQSKKRTHRIGQNRTCFYYRMIVEDSVEIDIYKSLEMRKDYTERLFEENETA